MSRPRFSLDPPVSEALVGQLVDVWTEVTNAGGAVGFVAPVTSEDVQPVARTALRRVSDGPDHLVVGTADGRLVAFAFLEHRSGELFRHWATVKRFQVAPQHQGTGLGGALLEAVHDEARELGLDHLRLSVRGGTGTEGFYRRFGWEEVARIPRSIRIADDDLREEIWLVRWL